MLKEACMFASAAKHGLTSHELGRFVTRRNINDITKVRPRN